MAVALMRAEVWGTGNHLHRVAARYADGPCAGPGRQLPPDRDATPWVRFCIAPHIQQARERLDQIAAATTRWAALEELAESAAGPTAS